MSASFRNLLSVALAAMAGAMLGYLHYSPVVDIPIASGIQWMAPYLKGIESYLYHQGLQYSLLAVVLFFLSIPNIVLVALLVSLAMKALRRPRMVYYATLIWPALAYLAYWFDVFRLKIGAARLGLPSDLEHLPVDVRFPTKAVGYLLIYSLYSLLVWAIFRFILRAGRHVSPDAAAQPAGAPVDL